MAKRRHEETQQESSKGAMIGLGAGGLLVAALVVWALTRTVQPVPDATTATFPVTGVEQTASTPAATPVGDTSGYVPAPPAGTTAPTSTYTPNPPSQDESATVARISVTDLRAKIDAKQVTVIDVRDKTSFISSHIPGSYHVPMATVESQVTFLPKDKPIVTYCT
jgi:hypothetical protein